jgi:hypothetical protein
MKPRSTEVYGHVNSIRSACWNLHLAAGPRNVSGFQRSLFHGSAKARGPHVDPDFLDVGGEIAPLSTLTDTTPTDHDPLAKSNMLFASLITARYAISLLSSLIRRDLPRIFITMRRTTCTFPLPVFHSMLVAWHPSRFQRWSHIKIVGRYFACGKSTHNSS